MSYDDFYRESFEIDGDCAEYFPEESVCVQIGSRTFWLKNDDMLDERIRELQEQYSDY